MIYYICEYLKRMDKKYVDKQSPMFYQLLKKSLKAEHPRGSPNNQKLAILPWNKYHKMYALCKQNM